MNHLLRPGDLRELVQLDVTYDNETWELSDPVPRQTAIDAMALFAKGWAVNGRRVVRALIIPIVP